MGFKNDVLVQNNKKIVNLTAHYDDEPDVNAKKYNRVVRVV